MQFFGQGKPAVGIVHDCDLGNRIDDPLAMALLYGLDGKNEARVVAVAVSKSNLKAAQLAEVIGRFYAGAVSGAFDSFSRTLPVGLSTDGKMAEDTRCSRRPLQDVGSGDDFGVGRRADKVLGGDEREASASDPRSGGA